MEPEGQGREGGVIAPEGIPFLLGAAAVAAVLTLVWPRTVPAALFGVLLTAFMGWFFRNPDRTPPSLPGAVISPADGKIVYAGDNPPGRYFGETGERFHVHLRRARKPGPGFRQGGIRPVPSREVPGGQRRKGIARERTKRGASRDAGRPPGRPRPDCRAHRPAGRMRSRPGGRRPGGPAGRADPVRGGGRHPAPRPRLPPPAGGGPG